MKIFFCLETGNIFTFLRSDKFTEFYIGYAYKLGFKVVSKLMSKTIMVPFFPQKYRRSGTRNWHILPFSHISIGIQFITVRQVGEAGHRLKEMGLKRPLPFEHCSSSNPEPIYIVLM